MKKLTLLLGTIIGLTTVSNVTYGSHGSQDLVMGSNAITAGKQLIDQTFDGIKNALINNLDKIKDSSEQSNAEAIDSLYQYVFGTDFLSKKHFAENSDLDWYGNSKMQNTLFESINKMHSIPLQIYENYNLSTDKPDKLNIEENKTFIKDYLHFLFTVRNKKMLAQNKNHWSCNAESEKHIENVVNLIADILVNDKTELDCNKFDFSNNSEQLDYAVRLVAQQIFENVQEGYQKCIKDENLTTNLNYMVGERSIPVTDVGQRSGDFFIGVEDLNRWLSIKKLDPQGDEAPDFVLNPDKNNLIPEKFYEQAFTDQKSETNFLGFSLLKCCLEGVVKREINKERNKNEVFIDSARNKILQLESAKRLLNMTSKFSQLLERISKSEQESVELKRKYEGEPVIKDESKQGKAKFNLPKINNQDVESVIQDLLYSQIKSALETHGNGDQLGYSNFEDIVRFLKNGISLIKNIIDKAIANKNCDEAKKLIDTYGTNVYEQLKDTKKTIDEFCTSLFPNSEGMEIETLKRLCESLETDCEKRIKGFLSDIVSLKGSIYNGNKGLFNAVKIEYYKLVKNVVIYFVDLGLIDEHKNRSMINGHKQNLLTFADLRPKSNADDFVTKGGESSSSGGNVLIKKEKNDDRLVIRSELDALKALKLSTETVFPTNINDVMIPGILRKAAIMFYNMTDTKSALYRKHEPKTIAISKVLNFKHDSYQLENSMNNQALNEAKTESMINNFYKRMKADKEISKDSLRELLAIKIQNDTTRLDSADVRRNAERFVTNSRDNHYQVRKVLRNTESLLDTFLKNAIPESKNRRLIAEYLTSFVFCSDNEDLIEQTNAFLSFLFEKFDKESEEFRIQQESLSWMLSQSEAQNRVEESINLKNLLEKENNKVEEYEAELRKYYKNQTTGDDTNNAENNAELIQLREKINEMEKQLEEAKQNADNLRNSVAKRDEELEQMKKQLEQTTKDLNKAINKYNGDKLETKNKTEDNVDIKGTIPPPPPLQPIFAPVLNRSQKTPVKKNDNIGEPVISMADAIKNVRLKKVTDAVIELRDPETPTQKIKLSSKDLQKRADDWYLKKTRLEVEGKTKTDEYKIITENLDVLLKDYKTEPSIKQNFLQNALSAAINLRRQNLHMYDEENNIDDDDDWAD